MSLIGRRVVCRSNEPEPYLVGELVGFAPVSAAGTPVPVVRTDDGRELLAMGIVLPHSDELASAMDAMDPRRQWEWAAEIAAFLRAAGRAREATLAEALGESGGDAGPLDFAEIRRKARERAGCEEDDGHGVCEDG